MKSMRLLAAAILTCTVAAAKADAPKVDTRPALPFPPGIKPESVCGEADESQHVEDYDGTLGVTKEYVKKHEISTVQLQWLDAKAIRKALTDHSEGTIASVRWCTGTLIAPDKVLTAAHCFDPDDGTGNGWVTPFALGPDGKPKFAKPEVLAKLMVVNFGFQKQAGAGDIIRAPKVFPIVRLLEYGHDPIGGSTLDYAIVEVGKSAGKLPDAARVAQVSTRAPVADERIAVIQHPQGDPKKVEAGKVQSIEGPFVLYGDLDTHGGSSGSGVRDKDGAVIGVHTNGGCFDTGGANRGVTAKAIADRSNLI